MKSGAGDGGSAAEDGRATAASSSSSSKQVPVMIESMPACCDIITDEQVSQSDRANLPGHTRCLGNCPSPAVVSQTSAGLKDGPFCQQNQGCDPLVETGTRFRFSFSETVCSIGKTETAVSRIR